MSAAAGIAQLHGELRLLSFRARRDGTGNSRGVVNRNSKAMASVVS
jgi:hypothetical protein